MSLSLHSTLSKCLVTFFLFILLDDKLSIGLIVDNSFGKKEILTKDSQKVIDFNNEEMI